MKKQLLLILMTLLPMVANAAAVEIGGIYYNLMSKEGSNVAEVTRNPNYYAGNVIIPEVITYEGTDYNVTSIGESAFYYCSELASVTIGNSVVSIGQSAFYNCSSLPSVTIPNSVTSIGEYAFYGCSSLKAVYITNMMAWCSISFSSLYSNPLYYAHNLFLNGEKVTDLVIPNSVTTIGNNAFQYCSGLTSVTIPNSVTTIGNNAFQYCI